MDSAITNDRLIIAFRKKKYHITFVQRHSKKPQALLFFSSYKGKKETDK